MTVEQALMRFSVDSWDTGYGSSVEVEGLANSKAEVNPGATGTTESSRLLEVS